MLQDEKEYPDPTVFKPERFLRYGKLNPDIRDPALMAFGFGRRYVVVSDRMFPLYNILIVRCRICPGIHVALSTLWMTAASVLSMFTISEALNDQGFPIPPVPKYRSGMIW